MAQIVLNGGVRLGAGCEPAGGEGVGGRVNVGPAGFCQRCVLQAKADNRGFALKVSGRQEPIRLQRLIE
jgi:hypothetical protein